MAFTGKVAFITGGASGMGKVMAVRLANQGAKVAIIDLDDAKLKETAALSPNIIPLKCDITDLKQVKETVARVEAEIGPIDRLAHCAAIMPGGILHETPAEEINRIMFINYFGMVNVTQTVLGYMRQRNKGDFIVFGSIAGVVPAVKLGAYGATKAATNMYMEVLIEENKGTGLRFQLVCPSAVDTPLINQAVDKGPSFLKEMEATGNHMDTPEFIIDTVEHCLDHHKQVNFPGIANFAQKSYRLFPSLIRKLTPKLL